MNLNYFISKYFGINIKICIIDVCIFKYYFEIHLIHKWHYYRQTIFNQLNIVVPYKEIFGLCNSVVTILWKISSKC